MISKTVYEHALRFGPDVAARLLPAVQRIAERIAKLSKNWLLRPPTAKEARPGRCPRCHGNNGSKPRYRGNRLVFLAAEHAAHGRLADCIRIALNKTWE